MNIVQMKQFVAIVHVTDCAIYELVAKLFHSFQIALVKLERQASNRKRMQFVCC